MTKDIFGLLWYDNDPKKSWRQKVKDTAERYKNKRWLVANLCHVCPKDVGVEVGLQEQRFVETLDGIEIYATGNTQPNNFWVTHIQKAQDKAVQPSDRPTTQQLSLL